MDLLRGPYSTEMDFVGDGANPVEVYWYPVPESRPFLPIAHTFASAEWEEDNPVYTRRPGLVGLGEQVTSERTRPERRRPARAAFRGVYCGTADQWRGAGGLPLAHPVGAALRFPECCGPESTPFPAFPSCPDSYFLATRILALYNRSETADQFAAACSAYFEGPCRITVWGPTPGPTSPAFAVVSFDDWDLVVITGTTETEHWIRQTLRAGSVHSYRAADGVGYFTHDLYQQSATLIENHLFLTGSRDRPLLITGHSMGGAVGNVLSIRATHGQPARECIVYTFGCPRCFDTTGRAAYTNPRNRFANVANRQDVVPLLPPHFSNLTLSSLRGITRFVLLETYWANLPGWFEMDEQGRWIPGEAGTIPGAILGSITDTVMRGVPFRPDANHSMEVYRDRLRLSRCFERIGVNPSPTPQGPDVWLRNADLPPAGTTSDGGGLVNWPAGPGTTLPAASGDPGTTVVDLDGLPALRVVAPASVGSGHLDFIGGVMDAAMDFTLFLLARGHGDSPSLHVGDPTGGIIGPEFSLTGTDFATTGVGGGLFREPGLTGDRDTIVMLRRTAGLTQLWLDNVYADGIATGNSHFTATALRSRSSTPAGSGFYLRELIFYKRSLATFEVASVVADLSNLRVQNMQTGMICWFPLSTAMDGWLMCDGDQFQQDAFPGLYAYLGDAYANTRGAPNPDDGFFRVPNLIGLGIVGAGPPQINPPTTEKVAGNTYGSESVEMTTDNLAPHYHELITDPHSHVTFSPPALTFATFQKGAAQGLSSASILVPMTTTAGGAMTTGSAGVTGITNAVGTGDPISIQPPAMALYPFIKT